MIRFIDLSNQIAERQNAFAFYDTQMERFVCFRGIHIWQSEQSFMRDYTDAPKLLQDYLNKIPANFKQNCLQLKTSHNMD